MYVCRALCGDVSKPIHFKVNIFGGGTSTNTPSNLRVNIRLPGQRYAPLNWFIQNHGFNLRMVSQDPLWFIMLFHKINKYIGGIPHLQALKSYMHGADISQYIPYTPVHFLFYCIQLPMMYPMISPTFDCQTLVIYWNHYNLIIISSVILPPFTCYCQSLH